MTSLVVVYIRIYVLKLNKMPGKRVTQDEHTPSNSNGWKAVEKYQELGFLPTPKPSEQPVMPSQISQITSDVLGDLQSLYAVWREYTEDNLLKSVAKLTELKTSFDYAYAKKFVVAGGSTDKQKKAAVDVLEEIHTMNVELINAQMLVDMLSSKLESFSNCLTIISREITRRENLGMRT